MLCVRLNGDNHGKAAVMGLMYTCELYVCYIGCILVRYAWRICGVFVAFTSIDVRETADAIVYFCCFGNF